MRVALLGCGMMGAAAARELALNDLDELVLLDADHKRAQEVASAVERDERSAPVRSGALDLHDAGAVRRALASADAIACALPWSATRAAIEAAAEAAIPLTSITRPDRDGVELLRGLEGRARSPVLAPLGLEPGLTEILARCASERLDAIDELHIRCGGLPLEPRPPLGHAVLFDGSRLPIVPRDAYMLDCGRRKTVPRFSGIEQTRIDGVEGPLEAFHDGMVAWLDEDPAVSRARLVTQKTLRWPGFATKVALLRDLGLLSEDAVTVDGASVVPIRLVESVLRPLVTPAGPPRDVTVLQVDASGQAGGRPARVRLRIVARHQDGLTGMARITGAVLALGTLAVARGELGRAGWCRPQEHFRGAAAEELLSALAGRGLRVEDVPSAVPTG